MKIIQVLGIVFWTSIYGTPLEKAQPTTAENIIHPNLRIYLEPLWIEKTAISIQVLSNKKLLSISFQLEIKPSSGQIFVIKMTLHKC